MNPFEEHAARQTARKPSAPPNAALPASKSYNVIANSETLYEGKSWTLALRIYNAAIRYKPEHPVLLRNGDAVAKRYEPRKELS